MKKKLLLVFSLLLIFPLMVKAEAGTNVKTLEATLNKNTINFSGTTQNDSLAVMCKLLDDQEEEIDMLSVEVDGAAFSGSFVTSSTGNYTVSCANYEGGTIVTADVTVTQMAVYTVTFNTNGGSTINAVEVESGQTVSRPQNDPTKDNYDFVGWYEDDTFTHEFDFSKKITKDTTIYANWVEHVDTVQVQIIFFGEGGTYQVDFAANDSINPEPLGVPVNSSHRYFVNKGDSVTLTAVPAEGYHFKGWYETHETNDEWSVDNIISNSTPYEFDTDDIDSYINIIAVFEEDTVNNRVTVTFNTDGGSEIEPIELDSGQTVERPQQDPTKNGYDFVNWYIDNTFTHVFDFDTPITEDTTIYAYFLIHRDADQIQIWASSGGKVAAQYTPSTPNTENLGAKDGTNFVANGEVVQYYINDNVTAIAKADSGYKFIGWKRANTENEIPQGYDEPPKCIGDVISTSTRYIYKPNVTVLPGDEAPIRYVCAAFGKEYTASDEGNDNSATFVSDQEHTFRLVIADLSDLTDEQLSSMNPPMDRETYEEIRDSIIEAASQYGTLISFLEIEVLDEHDNSLENVPVTVRIKITDEMKQYNTFKLVYVKDDLSLGTVTDLSIDGDYLVGSLEHLSSYALVGSNESNNSSSSGSSSSSSKTNTSKNPATLDNIYFMISIFTISLIGLLIGTKKFLKNKKVK